VRPRYVARTSEQESCISLLLLSFFFGTMSSGSGESPTALEIVTVPKGVWALGHGAKGGVWQGLTCRGSHWCSSRGSSWHMGRRVEYDMSSLAEAVSSAAAGRAPGGAGLGLCACGLLRLWAALRTAGTKP